MVWVVEGIIEHIFCNSLFQRLSRRLWNHVIQSQRILSYQLVWFAHLFSLPGWHSWKLDSFFICSVLVHHFILSGKKFSRSQLCYFLLNPIICQRNHKTSHLEVTNHKNYNTQTTHIPKWFNNVRPFLPSAWFWHRWWWV